MGSDSSKETSGYIVDPYDGWSKRPQPPTPMRHPLKETLLTSSRSEKHSQQNGLNRSFGNSSKGPQTMVRSSTISVQKSVLAVSPRDHRPSVRSTAANQFIGSDKEDVSMVWPPLPKLDPATGQKPILASKSKSSPISMAQKPNTQTPIPTTMDNALRPHTPLPPMESNIKSATTQTASLTAAIAKLSVNAFQACGSPIKMENNLNYGGSSKNTTVEQRLTLHWATEKLTARFNNQEFNVNYLDLYDDEHAILQKILSIEIVIAQDDVIVNGDWLSLQRLNVPTKTSPTDFNPIETKTNTQTVFFSNFNYPLIGKYRGNYYFICGRLVTEYMDLLKATGYPLGIAMRVNTDRIIENEAARSLDVTKATVFESDQDILVIEAFVNSDTKWIAPPLKKANLHRFLYDPSRRGEHSLMLLPDYLIYAQNGSVDEIFAELDHFDAEIDEDVKEQILVIMQIVFWTI